jgi:uncharacterized protein
MFFRTASLAAIITALIFSFSCSSTPGKKETPKASEEKADPKLKDTIVDHKEFYDDGSLKGEGKALYKIVMNKPVRIKQGKWTLYVKAKKGVKMSDGEYDNDKQTGKWTFFFEDGKIKEEGTYLDGLNTGEWKIYYPTGELFWKGTFTIIQKKDETSGEMKKVSTLNGIKTTFYKDGKVLKEEAFKNGEKDGRNQEYYSNGKPKEILMFKANKKSGALNEWWENGKRKTEGFFTEDKKSGFWRMYYTNGQAMMEGAFEADKPNGQWKVYSRESQMMKEGKYKAGKEDGLWSYYEYTNNKKTLAMELSIEGGMVSSGISKLYDSGVLIGEGILNGIPKAKFQIYKAGQAAEVIDAQNQPEEDAVQGISSKWTGKWLAIKKNGAWTEFYPGTKKKKFEATYMMDKKNGPYKEYYPDGKVKAEGKYLTDKKNDKWQFFNTDGSVDAAQSGLYMMDKKRGD